MLTKKGELTNKEILEIILAVAVVLVMGYLFYNLISPSFDKTGKTAESYFKSFKDVVDDGGSFSIWQNDSEVEFYLVYFGDKNSNRGIGPGNEIREFFSYGDNSNRVCVCFWRDGKSECGYCENLDLPILIEGGEIGEQWVLSTGEKINILKKENYYEVAVE